MNDRKTAKLEERRLATPRVQKNMLGLTKHFDGASIHRSYLGGLAPEEFASGLRALAVAFMALYTGMTNNPQAYGMKDTNDVKGPVKNMNFLRVLAQTCTLRNHSLEVGGDILAQALKTAKVTKPEMYFQIYESLGFVATGLGQKIAASKTICVEYPDNNHLLSALKAMADAVGVFSEVGPNRGSPYFDLLDYRILENHPATEPKPAMDYILSKLSEESRDIVKALDAFIQPFTKRTIKGDIGWYWTLTYTLKSTKKVIMSIKLDLEGHDIKLNLANIGQYTALLDGLPEKMIDEIKDDGWECSHCNSACGRAFAFVLDGKSYRKCQCGSFIFTEPSQAESKLLLGLLERELEFH